MDRDGSTWGFDPVILDIRYRVVLRRIRVERFFSICQLRVRIESSMGYETPMEHVDLFQTRDWGVRGAVRWVPVTVACEIAFTESSRTARAARLQSNRATPTPLIAPASATTPATASMVGRHSGSSARCASLRDRVGRDQPEKTRQGPEPPSSA